MKNKSKLIYLFLLLVVVIGGIITVNLLFKKGNITRKTINNNEVSIVLSLEDKIQDDTLWCGTMNLIWNDLKNDLAKQDIVFKPQLEVVDNLNKGTFNTNYLSENAYYKVYGVPSLKFKKQIEEAIKEKFNETSDILDDFNWSEAKEEDFFLYVMLKKAFEYPKKFKELPNGVFKDSKNIKYFGIDEDNKDLDLLNQIKVLYYKNIDEFAFKLFTKSNDEIIFAKGIEESSFINTYTKITELASNYNKIDLKKKEIVKIPYLDFKVKSSFPEIENKVFNFADGKEYYIEKALQTIQLELTETGAKIKSEAGMMVKDLSMPMVNEEIRSFILNDTFTMFLIEQNKDLPYFAAKINDIKKFQ